MLDDLLKDISSYFEQAHKVPAPPLVILGKSGSGKSALVAHYLRSKEVPANSFVFLHSATLCSATQDPGRALRRLIASLQKEFGWVCLLFSYLLIFLIDDLYFK